MAERYTRLFSLPKNLYVESAPVLIAAGALLRDNVTDEVFAQLKLKNIGKQEIRAVTVIVNSFDSAGRPIGKSVHHAYLDLRVRRDGEFGQKNLASLPDKTARSYTVTVTEVVFADGTIWTGTDVPWEPLEKQKTLAEYLGDIQLAEQYDIEVDKPYGLSPLEQSGLWFCACGAINRESETVCHLCKSERAKIFGAVNRDILKDRLNARLTRESEKKRRILHVAKRTAIITLSAVVACVACALLITKVIIPSMKYNNAIEMMDNGEYESAIAMFRAMGDYKDSEEQIEACETAILDNAYDEAIVLMDRGEYKEAIEVFESLGTYKDNEEQIENCETAIKDEIYNTAVDLMTDGNIVDAYESFLAMDGYKDSVSKAESLYEQYKNELLATASVGDTVLFGSYEQDGITSNGKEDIEWIVLAKEGEQILVISKCSLDCQPYNTSDARVTWETCTLRAWLNDTFLVDAFSAEEQERIWETTVSADKNPEWDTDPGNDTDDKIFILSIDELNKYFASGIARLCDVTEYAKANGADEIIDGTAYEEANGVMEIIDSIEGSKFYSWWLRTPGYMSTLATSVDKDGFFNTEVDVDGICVRPALWISIGSNK